VPNTEMATRHFRFPVRAYPPFQGSVSLLSIRTPYCAEQTLLSLRLRLMRLKPLPRSFLFAGKIGWRQV